MMGYKEVAVYSIKLNKSVALTGDVSKIITTL